MAEHATLRRNAGDRVIRVFISSTFRDMQAERDVLVLRIFPQLRRLCEERGVTWIEIDLRWGITEEQSQRGEVLPICLEEIRRCRPYFIGLLGERYGWIPEAIPADVLDREPWIKHYVDGADKRSVTELEILHGVLNKPEMADHAYFYFRDPKYVDQIGKEQREFYLEQELSNRKRLASLKKRIRDSGYARRGDYRDPAQLGEWVLADFTKLINSLYPEGQQPTPLDRERLDHEDFARSRARVYIGRKEYFDRLDAHVESDGSPLVVLGESGGGKSALLADWVLRRRDQHPDDFLLLHFIGASPGSANATGILRRIMLELKEKLELPDEVPTQPERIREAFPNWLAKAAGDARHFRSLPKRSSRMVLVLDGLNQLEDVDNAPDLGWLPRVFPKNFRVILSTLPGRSLSAIENRGWLAASPPLQVHPLDETERRHLIHDFLQQYTRDLGPTRTDRVVRAPQTANPLYLRVLLDELRVFGLHERLNERIDWYLEAQDPYALYRKVIARWEETYSEGINLVRDTLSRIWAARRGLSEAELLEALGSPNRPLPRANWSPLYLAMSDALVTRSGLLTFSHDFLRAATRDTYLPDESQQQAVHRQLAEYFQRQPTWTERKLDELPWQLAAASQWQQLHATLTEQACFLPLCDRDEFELLGYWLQLKPQYDLVDSYVMAFSRWEREQPDASRLALVANRLAAFLHDKAARSAAAEPLMRRAVAIAERVAEQERRRVPQNEERVRQAQGNVTAVLGNLAQLLHAANRLTEAEPLMRRVLARDLEMFGPHHLHVAKGLNNLAWLLREMNRPCEAEPFLRQALTIWQASYGTAHPVVATALNNLAQVLQTANQIDEAELLLRRALEIDEQHFGPEHPEVATDISNLAQLLLSANRPGNIESLMRRALAIDEGYYGVEHPHVARDLNNLGELLRKLNRSAEAEPLMRRAILLWDKIHGPDHPHAASSLSNLGSLLVAQSRLQEAEPILRHAIQIWEQTTGLEPRLAGALKELSQLLLATNRIPEAKNLMRRVVRIDEQLLGPDDPRIAIRLSTFAAWLHAAGQYLEAEPLIRRALHIDEKAFGLSHAEVATDLSNLAALMQATNRLGEAEPLMRRALAIHERTLGSEHPDVAIDLNNLAQLLYATNQLSDAEPLMRRVVRIFVRLTAATGRPHPHLEAALENYSQLLQAMGVSQLELPLRLNALWTDYDALPD